MYVWYFKGRRHGVGRCHFSNGDVYKGKWNKDDMDGKGCYCWNGTSNVYVGQWLGRSRHGDGVYLIVTNPNRWEVNDKETQHAVFKFRKKPEAKYEK